MFKYFFVCFQLTENMATQKKFFDLTKPDDISEIHNILYDSDSGSSYDESDEDDAIIPDFRVDEESEIEDISCHSPSLDQQRDTVLIETENDLVSPNPGYSQDSFLSSSDSEDDIPLAQIQLVEQTKLKILKFSTKHKGKNGFKWSKEQSIVHRKEIWFYICLEIKMNQKK